MAFEALPCDTGPCRPLGVSRSDGRERRNKEQSTGAPRSLLPPPSPPGGLRPRDPLARPAFPQNRGARTPELLSTSPPGAGAPHQGQRPAQAQTPLLFLLLEPSHDGPSPGQAPARKATAGKRRPGPPGPRACSRRGGRRPSDSSRPSTRCPFSPVPSAHASTSAARCPQLQEEVLCNPVPAAPSAAGGAGTDPFPKLCVCSGHPKC